MEVAASAAPLARSRLRWDSSPVAGKSRDPDGYALGKAVGAEVSRRLIARMRLLGKSRADMARATGLPTPHVTNLLNGTGHRLWQRHQIEVFCRVLGVSELELMGDLLFPEIGTVVSQHLPPGLAEFARRHEAEVTLADVRLLRDQIRVIEEDGKRAYDDRFWSDMLRVLREHRATSRRAARKVRKL